MTLTPFHLKTMPDSAKETTMDRDEMLALAEECRRMSEYRITEMPLFPAQSTLRRAAAALRSQAESMTTSSVKLTPLTEEEQKYLDGIERSVTRLRAAVNGDDFEWEINGGSPFDDAKVLLAEYDRTQAALRKIADLVDSEADEPLDDAIRIANAALAAQPANSGQAEHYRELTDREPSHGQYRFPDASSPPKSAAERTLERLGYTYTEGAEYWKPPLGKPVLWQHVKRGSIVEEVARGFAQVAIHPIEEMTTVVIYRHIGDGHWWVRNAVEFDDGRFVAFPREEQRGQS